MLQFPIQRYMRTGQVSAMFGSLEVDQQAQGHSKYESQCGSVPAVCVVFCQTHVVEYTNYAHLCIRLLCACCARCFCCFCLSDLLSCMFGQVFGSAEMYQQA